MPKSVIIVPTFDRPEMFFLALEHIQQAIRPPHADLWIAPETRQGHVPDPLYSIVMGTFRDLWPRLQVSPPHRYLGNSYNVLSALKASYQKGCDYVFLIEDDVLVSQDFFAWHLAVLAQGDYFCSEGCINQRDPNTPRNNDPEAYFLSEKDYSPWGICFPRESLAAIVAHAVTDYFADMGGYCKANFAESHEGTEQDGLILRVMIASGKKVAYPCVPRSFQAGYYGYHRSILGPQGTLQERVAFLRGLLNQPERLAAMDIYSEVRPCSLEPGVWTMPHLTRCENSVKS